MGFNDANAVSTLLTTESLLFAVFAVTLSFGASAAARAPRPRDARRLACAAAGVLTLFGSGAAVAWADLFLDDWPRRFADWFPVATLAIGIVAEPMFAWTFVAHIYRKPPRDD
jgi:hypothetical protein